MFYLKENIKCLNLKAYHYQETKKVISEIWSDESKLSQKSEYRAVFTVINLFFNNSL